MFSTMLKLIFSTHENEKWPETAVVNIYFHPTDLIYPIESPLNITKKLVT